MSLSFFQIIFLNYLILLQINNNVIVVAIEINMMIHGGRQIVLAIAKKCCDINNILFIIEEITFYETCEIYFNILQV